MFRVPGPWESKSSEKDIEDMKSVPAREKVNIILHIDYTFVKCGSSNYILIMIRVRMFTHLKRL